MLIEDEGRIQVRPPEFIVPDPLSTLMEMEWIGLPKVKLSSLSAGADIDPASIHIVARPLATSLTK